MVDADCSLPFLLADGQLTQSMQSAGLQLQQQQRAAHSWETRAGYTYVCNAMADLRYPRESTVHGQSADDQAMKGFELPAGGLASSVQHRDVSNSGLSPQAQTGGTDQTTTSPIAQLQACEEAVTSCHVRLDDTMPAAAVCVDRKEVVASEAVSDTDISEATVITVDSEVALDSTMEAKATPVVDADAKSVGSVVAMLPADQSSAETLSSSSWALSSDVNEARKEAAAVMACSDTSPAHVLTPLADASTVTVNAALIATAAAATAPESADDDTTQSANAGVHVACRAADLAGAVPQSGDGGAVASITAASEGPDHPSSQAVLAEDAFPPQSSDGGDVASITAACQRPLQLSVQAVVAEGTVPEASSVEAEACSGVPQACSTALEPCNGAPEACRGFPMACNGAPEACNNVSKRMGRSSASSDGAVPMGAAGRDSVEAVLIPGGGHITDEADQVVPEDSATGGTMAQSVVMDEGADPVAAVTEPAEEASDPAEMVISPKQSGGELAASVGVESGVEVSQQRQAAAATESTQQRSSIAAGAEFTQQGLSNAAATESAQQGLATATESTQQMSSSVAATELTQQRSGIAAATELTQQGLATASGLTQQGSSIAGAAELTQQGRGITAATELAQQGLASSGIELAQQEVATTGTGLLQQGLAIAAIKLAQQGSGIAAATDLTQQGSDAALATGSAQQGLDTAAATELSQQGSGMIAATGLTRQGLAIASRCEPASAVSTAAVAAVHVRPESEQGGKEDPLASATASAAAQGANYQQSEGHSSTSVSSDHAAVMDAGRLTTSIHSGTLVDGYAAGPPASHIHDVPGALTARTQSSVPQDTLAGGPSHIHRLPAGLTARMQSGVVVDSCVARPPAAQVYTVPGRTKRSVFAEHADVPRLLRSGIT